MIVGGPIRPRIVHKAAKISNTGGVSPLCAKVPRAINMKTSTWAMGNDFVTCPRCLSLLSAAGKS